MSKEKVSVSFFRIENCGFYKRGKEEAEFGSPEEVFEDLANWVRHKHLEETKLFNSISDLLPVYAFDSHFYSDRGEYLFITWNEVTSNKNNIMSVSPKAEVGQAKIDQRKVPAGNIPGYPAYFWVLPIMRIIAVFRFDNQILNGRYGFEKYIEYFLRYKSRFCVADKDSFDASEADEQNPIEVSGYQPNANTEPQNDLFPRYGTRIASQPSVTDDILKRAKDIRKMVRSQNLKNKSLAVRESLIQRLRSILDGKPVPPAEETTHFRVEISFVPDDPEEVKEIVESWEAESPSVAKEDRTGFVMKNETTPYWLDEKFLKCELNSVVTREDGIVTLKSLKSVVDNNRHKLMAEIK